MNFAIIGCGYVADLYMATLSRHPNLRLVGVHDHDSRRLKDFSDHYRVQSYPDLRGVLAHPDVETVLNLASPRSHYELNKACLEAGKHVYSEKPLAMDSEKAAELVRLAVERGLYLAGAPCSLLGETAQTMQKALADDAVGTVRLVYANFDDGMVHQLEPTRWRSASGAPWPAKDEFETGCTYEHAGYVLSWLAAFFGPVRRVQAFASCLVRDKGFPGVPMAPDFSVGCLEYDNGIVARVTCSIIAPTDKSLVIVGDRGVLHTENVRNDAAPVYLQRLPPNRIVNAIGERWKNLRGRAEYLLRVPFSLGGWRLERRYPFARKPQFRSAGGNKPVDFLRGPAEMAAAIREGRPCRLSPELALHMTELIETLQYPERFPSPRAIASTFAPIAPLPWD
jgi:predicted dehydrogenase